VDGDLTVLDETVNDHHAECGRHDLPAYGLASICVKLGRARSLRWLGGHDTLLDTRLQIILDIVYQADKLNGSVERSACHVAWHIKRNRHVVTDKERYCTGEI